MLEQTGILGIHVENEPQPVPIQKPAPHGERPKLFSPDKMTPAEMIGAGAVMLGNIAFVSWWAMNEGSPEVIEMIDTPTAPTTEQSTPTMIVPPSPTSELAEGSSDDAILEVAEVQQEGTFKEAFDAARAQVGPGGIFEWRGQWYNTYTAEEWTGMAPAGKEDYAMLVKPFLENSHNNFHESLHHDVLSGQDTHVEVAHLDTHSPAHSLEGQVDNMLQTPIDNGLDTLDNLFLNT